MGINKNITIVSEVLAVKASRLAAVAQQQQASRIVIAEDDVRPTTRKGKKGKQALSGRVRVERSREERTATITLCKGHYWVDLDIEI